MRRQISFEVGHFNVYFHLKHRSVPEYQHWYLASFLSYLIIYSQEKETSSNMQICKYAQKKNPSISIKLVVLHAKRAIKMNNLYTKKSEAGTNKNENFII